MSKSKWFIVYCDNDTSFSLISDTDAVFDKETLELGDSVKFYFNKTEYVGDVRDMGGDEDYDTMKDKLNELNRSNKKRDTSFHADRPRKTRGGGKFQEALHSLKPIRSRTATNNKKPTKSTSGKFIQGNKRSHRTLAKTPLSQLLRDEDINTSSDDDTSISKNSDKDKSSGSSPQSSPIPEDISALHKSNITKRKRQGKEQDLLYLKHLKSNNDKEARGHSESSVLSPSIVHSKTESSESSSSPKENTTSCVQNTSMCDPPETEDKKLSIYGGGSETRPVNVFTDSESEDKKTEEKQDQEKERNKNDKKVHGKKKDTEDKSKMSSCKVSNLNFLRYSADDADVVVVAGKSKTLVDKKFYVSFSDIETAKSAKNASVFAKTLLVKAFTDEALYKCSVSGGQYRAGGKANITQKPALPADVISVIIDVALHRQGAKKWNPQLSKKDRVSALRQKLVDTRPRLRRVFEPDSQ